MLRGVVLAHARAIHRRPRRVAAIETGVEVRDRAGRVALHGRQARGGGAIAQVAARADEPYIQYCHSFVAHTYAERHAFVTACASTTSPRERVRHIHQL